MNSTPTPYTAVAQPYPNLVGITPNKYIAKQLLQSYAGMSSELTAITQYFYNSLLAPTVGNAALGDLFSAIMMDEMEHLRLLGVLILAYGGDPGFMAYRPSGRTQWWNGSFVSYAKQPVTMLQNALRGEREAIISYQQLMAQLPNASARALIERIIADEEHHIALLTQALAGIPMPLSEI